MAVDLEVASSRPRTYFRVSQRLLRGYGPLAGFVVVMIVMSLLVPSKVQKVQTTDANAARESSDSSDEVSGATDTPVGETPVGGEVSTPGGGGGGTAAVTRCAGDQVQGDPYSPPCVQFSGNNGGATHHGVTATEIHVAARVLNEKGFQQTLAALAGASLSDTPDDIKRTMTALAEYFNTRYQFYGRKIVLDFYNGQGSNTTELLGGGRDKAQVDATTVQSMKSFADLTATSEPYADALARKDIVGFGDPYLSTKWHDDHRPYIWSIATAGTKVANQAAEYSTKKLCGKNATHAGGDLKGKPRKFATMAPENSWYQESVQVARGTFTAAKCEPGVNIAYQLDLGTMSNQATNIVAQLKSSGVTTILCGCDPVIPVFLSGAAARQSYFPEFIIAGTALTDTDIVGQLWNQEFAKHAFGISSLTEAVPAQQTLGYAAYRAVRKDEPAFSVDIIYYQMAQMAIGLQMAGPNLNPKTFEAGMHAYPGKLGPAGYWAFGPNDMTTADDVREIYWSPTAVSKYNQKRGAYLETDRKRYKQGEIPGGDPQIPVPG